MTASRIRNAVVPRAPQSKIVVTPARRNRSADAAPRTTSSSSDSASISSSVLPWVRGMTRWTCASIAGQGGAVGEVVRACVSGMRHRRVGPHRDDPAVLDQQRRIREGRRASAVDQVADGHAQGVHGAEV